MGKLKSIFLLVFALLSIANYSQTIKGIVLDQKTNSPIESASVYFDGTSIGTSTNANGEFQIPKVEGVTSPMIISFLGYQKITIPTYEIGKLYKILLIEDLDTLDEVVITSDDGMPRKIKLQQFRNEFLGTTSNGKSCKILNESDLIFRFNSKTKKLSASAKRPIRVTNDNLKYKITFEIKDFEIDYHYADVKQKDFGIKSVIYTGTSFYKDLDTINKNKTLKRRNKVYGGSVLHFMRALSKEQLEEEGYQVFERGFIIPTYKYIRVRFDENKDDVMVSISKRVNIIYDKSRKSIIEENKDGFVIDIYGNYAPIENVLFGGDMGDQRIGDSLPFDYQLIENK